MRRPALVTLLAVAAWTGGGLLLERGTGRTGQLALGIATAGLLAVLLRLQSPLLQAQTLAVAAVATAGEIAGSLVWGLYAYRLGDVPAFVPPGHGLVYLAGASLAALAGTRLAGPLVAVAAVGAAGWGLLGLAAPSPDLAGLVGCACLVAVLAGSRRPIYAGVFLVVGALELYGTALGTWSWAPVVPGLRLSQGNPPSGVASGYVLFDVTALALTARLRRRAQRRRARSASRSTGRAARISSRAASTFPHTSQSRNPRARPSPSR